MRDYGKVAPRFWSGGSGRRLRGDVDSQFLALYLMTCPAATMSGIYSTSIAHIAHETGLTELKTRRALSRLREEDIAHFDEEADLMWVVNMVRYQVAEESEARGQADYRYDSRACAIPGAPVRSGLA